MKTTLAIGTALTLGLGSAYGAGTCPSNPGPYLNGPQIDSLVNGQTVCANSASGGWNEQHVGGIIHEWHKNIPSDPREENLGTYTIQDNGKNQPGTITYTIGGASWRYYVTRSGANHIYCTSIGEASGITVNVRGGYLPISGCPNNPDK